jgi:hypothetical protein
MLMMTGKGQVAKVELGDRQSVPRDLTVTFVPGFVLIADNTGISGGVGLKHSCFPSGAIASMEFLV